MSSIHILTEIKRIENKGSKKYTVLTPQLERICQEEAITLKEHVNSLNCGWIDVEVVYPEIHDQESPSDGGYIIIPEILIPGRPYPIYVYLYAITTYSFNPAMGQREAAKRTQERFGLKTFSHTTLGRAIKRLEKNINNNEGEPRAPEDPVEGSESESKAFPTVNQIKERKEKVASYLKKASAEDISLSQEAEKAHKQPDYRRPPYTGAFIDACHHIVGYTFLNNRRLLL